MRNDVSNRERKNVIYNSKLKSNLPYIMIDPCNFSFISNIVILFDFTTEHIFKKANNFIYAESESGKNREVGRDIERVEGTTTLCGRLTLYFKIFVTSTTNRRIL